MQTIAINANNDIYLDNSGNIAVKTDINAMADIFTNKSQTNKGELLYNTEKGIDFFNTIFSSPYYPDLFQKEVVNELEDTDETQRVSSFEGEVNEDVYTYTAQIITSYGEVTLNG